LLKNEQKEKFAPICPDFVVEIRSKSDEIKYLQEKMAEYIENGTQLAWLIDRFDDKVYLYKADEPVQTLHSLKVKLSGDPILPGFLLDLESIIN